MTIEEDAAMLREWQLQEAARTAPGDGTTTGPGVSDYAALFERLDDRDSAPPADLAGSILRAVVAREAAAASVARFGRRLRLSAWAVIGFAGLVALWQLRWDGVQRVAGLVEGSAQGWWYAPVLAVALGVASFGRRPLR